MSGGGGGSGFYYWARRIRLVVAIACGGPLLIALAIGATLGVLKDPGDLVVLAPPEESVSVSIDGGDVHELDPGTWDHWLVNKGTHQVHIQRAKESFDQPVKIGLGFKRSTIVPVGSDQCFVLFDVTDNQYWQGAPEKRPLPKVKERYSGGTPFKAPGSTYLFDQELPETVDENAVIREIHGLPCEDLTKSDNELAILAGFTGRVK